MNEGSSVLVAKLLIGLLCAAAMIALAPLARSPRLSPRQFDLLALLTAAITRLGLFTLLYLVMGKSVPSDVYGYYMPTSEAALSGKLVYRDFHSSYAPLFVYLGAGLLSLWHDARVFVLFAILMELISIPAWLGAARRCLPDSVVRAGAVMYLLCPLVLLNVTVGSNQVWVAAFVAWGFWLITRHHSLASGLLTGLALSTTKLLLLLFAPMLWLGAARPWRWVIGFLLLPVIVYGLTASLGGDILAPLRFEGEMISGGNLPFLLSALNLSPKGPAGSLSMLALLVVLGTVFLLAASRGAGSRTDLLLHLTALVLLSFMILSRKSFTPYLVMGMFAVCLTVAASGSRWPRVLGFGLFTTVAAIEPSLLFRWIGSERDLSVLWHAGQEGYPSLARGLAFLLVQLLLVGGLMFYWTIALKRTFPAEAKFSAR